MSNGAPHTAAVIIIGNEILSGRTRENNLSFIGQRLDSLGIALLEARIIPDDEQLIADTVNDLRARFGYVFTTGGIGPTHDDITSASIARAFNVRLTQHPDALAALKAYYEESMINDARLKMANIPQGGILIDNPVSGAPGFQLENVFVLPGVPLILRAMFEGIEDRLAGGPPILTESVVTDLREGQIAEDLAVVQRSFPDVSIGSYPFFKRGILGVNLVMRSRDSDRLKQATENVKTTINKCGGKILKQVLS